MAGSAGILFLAGAGVGTGLTTLQTSDASRFFNNVAPVRTSSTEFKLTRPLIAYETPEATPLEEYASLKNRLQDAVDHAKQTQKVEDVSVYYRSLETGRWIGIKQNSIYYPASLLKVPVMIVYFRMAESDSQLMNRYMTYRPVTNGNPFDAPSTLTSGRSYTVLELVEHMIKDSDNGATYTLLSKIDEDLLAEVYSDLGIQNPGKDSSKYQISTKTYALFFRILYNATYLSPASSEKALELLAQVSYTEGLVAGVPKEVTVAHKFGEHILSQGTQENGVELHDCGIVYHPTAPYLLCIMTRARDLPSATSVIASLSKLTYEAADAQHR